MGQKDAKWLGHKLHTLDGLSWNFTGQERKSDRHDHARVVFRHLIPTLDCMSPHHMDTVTVTVTVREGTDTHVLATFLIAVTK